MASPEGDQLIVKDYYHGASPSMQISGSSLARPPRVDRKGVFDLAEEVADAAERSKRSSRRTTCQKAESPGSSSPEEPGGSACRRSRESHRRWRSSNMTRALGTDGPSPLDPALLGSQGGA